MDEKINQSTLFPDEGITSGILTDKKIEEHVNTGILITTKTFQSSSLEASSYDISVGDKGILGGEGKEIDIKNDTLELLPGAYAGVISYECLILPKNVCARIGSKRALSYDGIILLTGSIVDPGYEGHLIFGLYNASQRKAIIRYNRKICNIVFEILPTPPEKLAPSSPNLMAGTFPDEFVDRMANMDVLPWMQISERVKQIEEITKDIIDLKARYEDVLQPIRDLTDNVKSLSKDVASLTNDAKALAGDVEEITKNVKENSQQINNLTANIGALAGQTSAVQSRMGGLEQIARDQTDTVSSLKSSFGVFKVLVYIFWAILILILGSFLPELFKKLFGAG